MIHLILKSAKEVINYSKFLYLSKIVVAFTFQAEEESVIGMALISYKQWFRYLWIR